MNPFQAFGLAEPILRATVAQGFDKPTPIQAKVIPAMMAGRDVVGIAQTGTGKTAAFSLPLLDRLAADTQRPAPKSCRALILVPTRELAAQIVATLRENGQFLRVTVAEIVGGVRPGPQIKAMARGVDIVVATPGRLIDHMDRGVINLGRTTTVVLDEADQMMDLGFLPAVRRIMARVPKDRQTVLMSATMPREIRSLAAQFLDDPVEISVAPPSRPVASISQSVRMVDRAEKQGELISILSGVTDLRAIVFTRTKRGADKVHQSLQKANLAAAVIHGNKSQPQRERALAGFRSGTTAVLVATDIAARGIDIDDVSHVINYELPNVPESYVHRIGRTARAGRSGIAIALCEPSERKLLADIERLIGNRLPRDGASGGGTRRDRPGNRPDNRSDQCSDSRPDNRQDSRSGGKLGDKPGNRRPARDGQNGFDPMAEKVSSGVRRGEAAKPPHKKKRRKAKRPVAVEAIEGLQRVLANADPALTKSAA